MSMGGPGATWHSSSFPFAGVTNALDNARQRIVDRRTVQHQENLRHENDMARVAQEHQNHLHGMVVQGAINHFLQTDAHSNALEMETHRNVEMGKAFSKMGRYAKAQGAQLTTFSHGQTSASFNYPAAQTQPTAPAAPAAPASPQAPAPGSPAASTTGRRLGAKRQRGGPKRANTPPAP